MGVHDDLGVRMKTFYEGVYNTRLTRRTPVVIRIDGDAFHTFTKGFKEPFDDVLIKSMQETTKYLCEHVQGCVLGYCQSDEISLILVDYNNLNTSAWFDYKSQKICSISASMTTMAFNKFFWENVQTEDNNFCYNEMRNENTICYIEALIKARDKGAIFDARAFNIPKEEVTNYIYWRQLDAIRNSIQMVGQAYFSDSELDHKSQKGIKEMLIEQKGIDYDSMYSIYKQRGTAVVRNRITYEKDEIILRDETKSERAWVIDKSIPLFKGDNRKYIDSLVFVGEE